MRRAVESPCPYCGGRRRGQPVFKKVWWHCAGCGNATAQRRERYPLDGVPRALRRFLPTELFANPDLLRDPGSAWYLSQSYATTEERDTPYAGEVEKTRGLLTRFGIDTTGAILDISGGPGFVARDLGRTARRVLMTDYTAHVLPFARSIGVHAILFDYQGAPLETCVSGPFDLVMARYSLNWCHDLARFVGSLDHVCNPTATFLLAGFLGPSRGACLTSALEDVGPDVLWHPDFVAGTFEQAGWRVEAVFEVDPPMPYWRPHSRNYRPFSLPWEVRPGPFPRDNQQYHHGFVFRRG